LHVEKIWIRDSAAFEVRFALIDRDELLWLWKRQRLQQHTIHNREQRCVRSNAERERHYDHGSEAGVLEEHSNGKQKVLEHNGKSFRSLDFGLRSSFFAFQSEI
jgi:hypothetical protein